MVTEEHRKLLKIHNHLISMVKLARDLKEKPMSINEQAEAVKRLAIHAAYASARFGVIVANNVGIMERMEIEYEPYAKATGKDAA